MLLVAKVVCIINVSNLKLQFVNKIDIILLVFEWCCVMYVGGIRRGIRTQGFRGQAQGATDIEEVPITEV